MADKFYSVMSKIHSSRQVDEVVVDFSSLRVDKIHPTPAYLQLKEQLAKAIARGDIVSGEALPSERDLADSLGIARMTVRRAFEKLVEENLVEQRQGSGTFVRAKRLEQSLDRVLGFAEEAKSLGFNPGSIILEASHISPDEEIANYLALPSHSANGMMQVLRISRLRTADTSPLALQTAYLPKPYSGLGLERLEHHGSLYKALAQEFGIYPHQARQIVSARLPSEQECERLEMHKYLPILQIIRITSDQQGRIFECVRSAYRSDKYQLSLNLRGI
ncbi:MAG: GntR family transcriptional regulator [Deinococcales bacterium]